MKHLHFLTLLILAGILTACNSTKVIESQRSEISLDEFSQKYVAFLDARIRSIDSKKYVKELHFVNFSDRKIEVQNTYFNGFKYSDNGKGNDLIANDGIFTSDEEFNFDSNIVFDKQNPIKSVLNTPIVSPNFEKRKELQEYLDQNGSRILSNTPNKAKLGGSISCDIKFGGGGCRACEWWGGRHCDWCFTLSNCKIELSI